MLMLLCVQAVTPKGRPKCNIIENQERKKQLSGYKLLHIQKSKLRSVQIYEFGSLRVVAAGSALHLRHMQ